jgi:hypothetical protein
MGQAGLPLGLREAVAYPGGSESALPTKACGTASAVKARLNLPTGQSYAPFRRVGSRVADRVGAI